MKRSKQKKPREKANINTQPQKLTKQEIREQRRRQRKINKRKRIVKRLTVFLIIIGVIGIISFGAYEAVNLGVFNVTEIEVVGNEIIDAQTVIDASGINVGESIFLVDVNQANYNIHALLNLNDLEISKIMPNKILIRMVESTPICAVNYDNKVYYLTEDKKLIEDGEYLRKTDIPLVFGSDQVTVSEIGKEVVVEPYWRFDTVMNILIDLKADNNLNKISEVRMTDVNTYEIVSKNGTVFVLWDYGNYSDNKAYIQSNLDKNTSNMIINLAAGTKPVIKPR
ncbi:cell division protein FtsQ/DivIB [Acetobacterium woodii]|uniref:Division initiation protein FtsQ n=1 Tax=Acetobacterium woodii (strain ATCC 29683 / DSM 1030 / JCM 2381 / KCTC 1655 / WB1) TaxID=931626 RepID=H6LCG9_ACEWD|nr:FtsQ-type POTRA domain-containing protein [Acetobacterium woodii]AFA47751.1 division initiation protein FtsQ [Acetobacterium woodii DSM 1030]